MPIDVTPKVATEAYKAPAKPTVSNHSGNPSVGVETALPGKKAVRQIEPTFVAPVGNNLPSNDVKETNKAPPEEAELQQAISQINNYVQSFSRDLHFKIDKDENRVIIEVIDSETKEIIRVIPPEDAVEIALGLGNGLEGLIIKAQA